MHADATRPPVPDLATIQALARADMAAVDALIVERMQSQVPVIPLLAEHLVSAGGKRLVQRTDGFDATIVSGAVVYRQGEATGLLPGRLVRGAREAARGLPGLCRELFMARMRRVVPRKFATF